MDDLDIETVHVFGAAVSSISVILNGLLLVCIFVNRKKAWFTGRRELSSLVVSDFVIGVAAVLVFVARRTLSTGSTTEILRLVEEAIYFTSKCVTINHLLLISLNGLLHMDDATNEHRPDKSFHIQSLFIWLTTLSWLVIPVILLGNECSVLQFADCQVLTSGPTLMVQFISFIFGCPWVLTNVFYCAYLIWSHKRGDDSSIKCHKPIARLFRSKRMRELKRWRFKETGVNHSHLRHKELFKTDTMLDNTKPDFKVDGAVGDTFVEATENRSIRKSNSVNSCVVHFGSFKRPRNENTVPEETNTNTIVLAVGLMLLAFDISILSIVVSFLRHVIDLHIDVVALKILYFLTFVSQAANPLIFILTLPNVKLIIKKMKFLHTQRERRSNNGQANEVRILVTPPLKQRFKTVSFSNDNILCSCDRNATRRSTVDGVMIDQKQRNTALLTDRRPIRYTSDTILIRNFDAEHLCENTGPPDLIQVDDFTNSPTTTLRVPNRKQSATSGRSITSGGLSIEMESQMSVSDVLTCEV